MGLFTDGFKELKKASEPLYKSPKSIQETIEIMAVADRCTVLRRGKYIVTVNIADTNQDELSRMMVGRDVQLVATKEDKEPGEVILHVENMTVPSKLHHNNAVKNVSFDGVPNPVTAVTESPLALALEISVTT